jgi:hypothetical protein
MMASRGCSILGSGTSSQRMSPLPCQAKAFICCSRFLPLCCRAARQRAGPVSVRAAARWHRSLRRRSWRRSKRALGGSVAACACRRGQPKAPVAKESSRCGLLDALIGKLLPCLVALFKVRKVHGPERFGSLGELNVAIFDYFNPVTPGSGKSRKLPSSRMAPAARTRSRTHESAHPQQDRSVGAGQNAANLLPSTL